MAHIVLTKSARADWQDMFPHQCFDYEMFDALAAALMDPALEGNPVPGMRDPGTTYEFIFKNESRPVYAKINLLPDQTVIIIYSTHRPLKGDTL
jgi:hypothetical protein